MRLKTYECKACGTLVFLKPKERRTPSCPVCRGGMEEIESVEAGELAEFRCAQCNYQFCVQEGISPYKCPNCNFTFVTTPKKIQEERL